MPTNRRPADAGKTPNNQTPKPSANRRAQKSKPGREPRVRTKRLDQIDEDKIALAYWLLAKAIVDDRTGQNVTPEEARRVAAVLDDDEPEGVPVGVDE